MPKQISDFIAATSVADVDNFLIQTSGGITQRVPGNVMSYVSWSKGSDIASASTLTLGDGNYFDITGTTTITAINNKKIGFCVKLHFDSSLTLQHDASNLILPGGSNITMEAGSEAEFIEYDTGKWRCTSITQNSGAPLVSDFGNLD